MEPTLLRSGPIVLACALFGCGGLVDDSRVVDDAAPNAMAEAGVDAPPPTTPTSDGGIFADATDLPGECNDVVPPPPAKDHDMVVDSVTPKDDWSKPIPNASFNLASRTFYHAKNVKVTMDPIAVRVEVKGSVWQWVERDSAGTRRFTYVATVNGPNLVLTPTCGGGPVLVREGQYFDWLLALFWRRPDGVAIFYDFIKQ